MTTPDTVRLKVIWYGLIKRHERFMSFKFHCEFALMPPIYESLFTLIYLSRNIVSQLIVVGSLVLDILKLVLCFVWFCMKHEQKRFFKL